MTWRLATLAVLLPALGCGNDEPPPTPIRSVAPHVAGLTPEHVARRLVERAQLGKGRQLRRVRCTRLGGTENSSPIPKGVRAFNCLLRYLPRGGLGDQGVCYLEIDIREQRVVRWACAPPLETR
jgi:hypothetical protein